MVGISVMIWKLVPKSLLVKEVEEGDNIAP